VRFAQAQGLPPVLPPGRVRKHLLQVFARCVKPLRDSTGDGIGDVGAVNAVGADGKPLALGLCSEVSVAATYQLAATMYHLGAELKDDALRQAALHTARGAYYQTWYVSPDKPLWAFNTPQAWHAENPARARAPQAIDARAVWELVLAIRKPFAAPVARE
jgi:hypothetical protein